MHTSWKQLEEELDVLENIKALELKSGELEEELVEGLELSTEDLANEDDVEEEEEESVRDDEEKLEEDDPSTIEEEESDEDDEDRVEDNDELGDEDEVWALVEELSTLFAELKDDLLLLDRMSRFEDEEEHEA